MASQKEFTEGIKSYRTRLETELDCLKGNIEEFNNADYWKTKRLISDYRRAVEKINLYLTSVEAINEDTPREDRRVELHRTSIEG